MKFNFKKISAVVAGVLMTGMTLGVAHAASYPEPLVVDGQANAAIVYGSNAASTDEAAASDLMADLDDYADSVSSGSSASLGEESFLISAPGNSLTMGSTFKSIKERLTSTDLPGFLSDGKIRDGDGSKDYEQKLNLGEDSVAYGSLNDEEDYMVNTELAGDLVPVLHVDQESGEAWELVVEFDDTFDATDVRNSEELEIAGKRFTVDPDVTAGGELTLFSSSNTIDVEYQETRSIEVNGETYEITLTGGDTNEATVNLQVDGESHSAIGSGEDFWVGDQKFIVNTVSVDTLGGSDSMEAEIFAGADEMVITDSLGAVEINDEYVDGVNAVYETGSDLTKLETLRFEFVPGELDLDTDEAYFLEKGESIKDPVFGTIGMFFESASMELDDEEKSVVDFNSGENLEMSFTSKNGNEYSFDYLEYDEEAAEGSRISFHENFYNDASQALSRDDVIVLAEGSDSDLPKVVQMTTRGPSDETEIEFKDLSTGSTTTVESGDRLWTTGAYVVKDGDWTLATDETGTTPYSISELYTESNAIINLNYTNATADITVHEDEGDEGNMTVKISEDTDDDQIDVDFDGILKDDEGENGYYLSNFGSYVESDEEDNNEVVMYIPAEEVEYNVHIGSVEESEDDDGEDTVGIGDILVTDSEVSSVDDKNLVVVGGSCINTAAAELLGVPEETCGEDFTDATGVGSGEALIKGYEDSDLTSEFAVLVAGYEAGDTTDAAKYLMNEKPDTSEELKVTSATEATVVSA